MKKLLKTLLVVILILLCITLAGALGWSRLYQRYQPLSYQASTYQETNAPLNNPFRGFHHLYGFMLSEDDPETTTTLIKQFIDSGSLPLMLIQINLKNYANADLSDNALAQLDRILEQIQASKRQVILRFLYDWDGNALETEPDNIEQIIRHMDQIGPVVNRYADAVFLLQSTFTGNCGEMNATKFGSHEHNRLLMSHLAQVTDPSIYLAVRTPSHLRGVSQTRTPVSAETAYDGSLGSRLGLFNDGMFGSVFDLGTYDDTPNADTASPEDKGTRDEEIAFQDYICQFVPNGGEAIFYEGFYSDFENALPDLIKMHVTYLSCEHHAAALDGWKNAVYHGDDCFDGVSGYEYISAHLGYRYMVIDSDFTYDALDKNSGVITLTIKNAGFAPAYRLFDGFLSLKNTDTGLQLTLPVTLDNRTIGGGSQAEFSFPLTVGGLPEGDYQVSFFLTDPYTEQLIQFANQDTDATGRVILGTLTVEPASQEGLLSLLLERWQNR
ncbi:MAG: DUF4832 domain-containing protein [Acetatifactor sp.]|nr:DUF4832 domain-containing protein [Acetatifactor sp.]